MLLGLTDLKILELLLIGSIPAALIGGFLVARLPIKITRNILAATTILASVKLFNG